MHMAFSAATDKFNMFGILDKCNISYQLSSGNELRILPFSQTVNTFKVRYSAVLKVAAPLPTEYTFK